MKCFCIYHCNRKLTSIVEIVLANELGTFYRPRCTLHRLLNGDSNRTTHDYFVDECY